MNPASEVVCNCILVVIAKWKYYKYLESMWFMWVPLTWDREICFCFTFCTPKWSWLWFDLLSTKHTWNIIPTHHCINVAYCCNTLAVHMLQWNLNLIWLFFFLSKFDKGYGKGFKTLHIFIGNTRKYQLSTKVFNEFNNCTFLDPLNTNILT